MANMSYCRFENTFHDLEDCAQQIESGELPSSASEKSYRTKLIQLCRDIVEQVGDDDVEAEDDFNDDHRPFPGEGQDGGE